jgi:hypothetical protein
VAACCFIGYIIAGLLVKPLGFGGAVAVSLPVSLLLLLALLLALPRMSAARRRA